MRTFKENAELILDRDWDALILEIRYPSWERVFAAWYERHGGGSTASNIVNNRWKRWQEKTYADFREWYEKPSTRFNHPFNHLFYLDRQLRRSLCDRRRVFKSHLTPETPKWTSITQI